MDADDIAATLTSLLATFEALVEDRAPLSLLEPEVKVRLLAAMGRISAPEERELRKQRRKTRRESRSEKRQGDRALRAETKIRKDRENPLFLTPRRARMPTDPGPSPGTLEEARVCYVCRQPYVQLHAFYDQLCPSCGDFNWHKRHQTADLTGRVALVTGGRVKIGYQACILLLRAGCTVIVTTRFPRDAAARFAAEPDFESFAPRLQIHGIDLRHTPSVEALCERLLGELDRLDFIVNNACQTVRRPPGFYEHLLAAEREKLALPGEVEALLAVAPSRAAELTQIALLPEDLSRGGGIFPEGRYDQDGQQIDLRKVNSWRLKLAEVPTIELLEVHLVNAVAPFVINARLKPLMQRVPTRDKHIVNVSAMEGQFYRTHKTDRHPHTNMAKASLNMLTRTSAMDYIEDGIHMNSVDTGWVTDEDPVDTARYKVEMHGFSPPLDIVDGAARIIDPIFSGFLTGKHLWGLFLKDYKPTDW